MADPAQQINAAERRARVVELRRQHVQFADIGAELGVSPQRAHQIYREALKEVPAAHVEEHRAEEVDLCDEATTKLRTLADDETISPRTRIEAWSAMRGWATHKAHLLGLNAPAKVVTTVTAAPETPDIVRLVEIAKAQADAARDQLDTP